MESQIVRVNVRSVVNLRVADMHAFQEDIKVLTDENYQRLKTEILEDGFSFSPHIFFDGENKAWILDGHQRKTCLERMAAEGYEIPSIPCMEVEAEDLAHARRLVLAGTSQYGTFKVQNLVEFTKKTGLDGAALVERFILPTVKLEKLIDVSGYSRRKELDVIPEPPAQPRTKLGQVYVLGKHRLMCGNSQNAGHIQKLMGNENADITFTSPPYNASTESVRKQADGSTKKKKLYEDLADDLDPKEYVEFANQVLHAALVRSDRWVFWNVNYNANCRSEFLQQLIPHIHMLEETICWHKKVAIAIKHGLTRRWEPVFVFRAAGNEDPLYQGGDESNFWDLTGGDANTENHRAAFPVALPEKAMVLTKAESVFDPFGGTGSTMIAAEVLNKACFMMEISPAYCDSIIERWEKFSGKKAELSTT